MEPDDCASCRTPNPVGGLRRTRRNEGFQRVADVWVCELCANTVIGMRFLEGFQVDEEMLTLLQGLNIIRKDVAAVLDKLAGKKG